MHEEAVENSTPFDTYEEMHDSQVQEAATKLAAAQSKLQARHARNVKQREKRKQTQYIPQATARRIRFYTARIEGPH